MKKNERQKLSLNFKKLFPKAERSAMESRSQEVYSLWDGEEYLLLNPTDLTEREQVLLDYFLKEKEQHSPQDPWLEFLSGRTPHAPNQLETVQFFYLSHSEALDAGLQAILENLLPPILYRCPIAEGETIFLLEWGLDADSQQQLASLLPTLENDFSNRLSMMVG
ncbi:hypothetical protein, partial [Streptococcus sp. DD13]|uniref:hypothetical protein n=1 Tax=Streptococcus sp. DD13 TaxID=1777881 RepID=UPI0018D3DA60